MVKTLIKQMIAAGALICLLLYMVGYSRHVLGFALGVAASLANCVLLSRQLKKVSELPMERAVAKVQSGWFIRLALVVFLLVLSMLFAEVNFIGALAGFFIFQAVIIVRTTLSLIRR